VDEQLIRVMMRTETGLEEFAIAAMTALAQNIINDFREGRTNSWMTSLADLTGRRITRSADVIVLEAIHLWHTPSGRSLHGTVSLPADTICEIEQADLYYVAAVLLAVIALLLTFAGPVMISKLPQADQPTMTDYYSGVPGLAVTLTAYVLSQWRKGK
jgi:hypothetical protein